MTRIELISAIVVVTHDTDDLAQTHQAYRPALARLGRPLEFIYVIDGPMPRAVQSLRGSRQRASRSRSCPSPPRSVSPPR